MGVCEEECHSCEFSLLYEALEGWKSVLWLSPQLKGVKGKVSFFSFLLTLMTYFGSFHGMMRGDPAVAGSG